MTQQHVALQRAWPVVLSALLDRLFASLRHRLQLVDRGDVRQLGRDIGLFQKEVRARLGELHEAIRHVERGAARADERANGIDEQLARFKAQLDAIQLYLRRVDRFDQRADGDADASETAAVAPASFPPPDRDWRLLETCPVCGHPESTLVSEYNKFFLHGPAPEPGFEIYNYSLCHACGTVYATRRPVGARYRALLANFTESLGRPPKDSLILNPRPLTPAVRLEVQRRARQGVLVSEHSNVDRSDWMGGLLADRLAGARHLEVIGSLVSLDHPRVLEIRSRTGAILQGLRRLYGAEVCALAIFESQQLLLQTVYDIRADALIDFEDFDIPYEGEFDLIVSNHMMTHTLSPERFLSVVRERLRPGGHLYLYNEPDDLEFTDCGQSMFNVLNPFHMQTYNRASLVRALAVNGFSTAFVGHIDLNFYVLAQKAEHVPYAPMSDKERRARVKAYRRARDVAVLRLPEELRPLFANEWDVILERAVVSGLADVNDRGRITIRPRKRRPAAASHEVAYH